MIEVVLALSDEKLREIISLYLESYAKKVNEEFLFINGIKNIEEGLEKERKIVFYELEKKEDLERVKELKENFENIDLFFISHREDLVFEAVILQPLQFIRVKSLQDDLKMMQSILNKYIEKEHKIITLKTKEFTIRLKIRNILYIESYGHYIIAHSTTGEYKVRYNISKIEKELNSSFIRVHKSYIVNLNFLSNISRDQLTLKNKIEIPVGRVYRENLILTYEGTIK